MAMDADSFSLMVAPSRELTGWRGERRKRALWACAKCYRDGMGADELRATVKQEYGSVILLFVIEAVLGGIISWAVQKFMQWLEDRHKTGASSQPKLEILRAIREQQQ